MTNTQRFLGGLLLPFLPAFTLAVSLSDFTPRNNNLSPQCNSIYTQQVPNCQQSDFTASNPNICSLNCVKGLVTIQNAVQSSCTLDNVSETSMIGLFLLGSGISILCPNFKVQTLSSSITSARPTMVFGTSTLQVSSVPTPASSIAMDTSASASPPRTTSPTSAVSSPGNIVLDTTTAPSATGGFAVTATSSTSSSKAAKQSQKSNKDSGGGSPFDVQASTSDCIIVNRPLLMTLVASVLALIPHL